ncbi:unnamed protein product [Linum tenue]|uniref:Uncharacterized protein n=1 Tax=Linum tenue TaxID=586396 RepID=A0AAV0KSR7_9ROSI|nr:unnamed protein product [Linum tenue]
MAHRPTLYHSPSMAERFQPKTGRSGLNNGMGTVTRVAGGVREQGSSGKYWSPDWSPSAGGPCNHDWRSRALRTTLSTRDSTIYA